MGWRAAMMGGSAQAQRMEMNWEIDGIGNEIIWDTVWQVDGCSKDLSLEKEYYQRYRICEEHLKLSSLLKDGVQQRFCQQCGRFHLLADFDGDKRCANKSLPPATVALAGCIALR